MRTVSLKAEKNLWNVYLSYFRVMQTAVWKKSVAD